eukprot:850066-Prorocentrum_minimum.AAC.3
MYLACVCPARERFNNKKRDREACPQTTIVRSEARGKGRGRLVLPAAQRGALCPVHHPFRGPLLVAATAKHGLTSYELPKFIHSGCRLDVSFYYFHLCTYAASMYPCRLYCTST